MKNMFTKSMALVAVFSLTTAVSAQQMEMPGIQVVERTTETPTSSGTWSVKPYAGFSLSNFYDDTDANTMKFNPVVGADVSYRMHQMLELSLGLCYQQLGAKSDNGYESVTYRYLGIPLMLRFHAFRSLFVGIGFQPNILLWARDSETRNNVSVSLNMKDYSRSVDLALPIELGVEEKNIVFSVRYLRGLTTVVNKTEKLVDELNLRQFWNGSEPKTKHYCIMFSLGYKFNI